MSQENAKASLPDRGRAVILDAVQDQDNVDMGKVEEAVTAMVDSINRLVVASRTANALDAQQSEALDSLNSWLSAKGNDVSASTPDAWNITRYEDAFVFSSGHGRRSNTLYLVRCKSVSPLNASVASLADAYKALGNK